MVDNADETEPLDVPGKLQYLAGQIHALTGFCVAVINAYPDPTYFARHIEAAEQATLANAEASPVPDEFVDGVQNVFDRLKRIAAKSPGWRRPRDISQD